MPQDTEQRKRNLVVIFIIVGIAIVGVLALSLLLVERIPPTAMTRTSIMLTEHRIREYVAKHHKLPTTLDDLPKLEENRDSRTVDGWGQPIQYSVNGQTVTLQSFGSDNKPGGTGENADIKVIFTIGELDSEPATKE